MRKTKNKMFNDICFNYNNNDNLNIYSLDVIFRLNIFIYNTFLLHCQRRNIYNFCIFRRFNIHRRNKFNISFIFNSKLNFN